MSRHLLSVLALVLSSAALGVSACGGDDGASEAASSETTQPPRIADFELPQRSDIGLREAFATFTEQGDVTTAVIEIIVERTEQNLGLTYPVAIHAGSCDALGETERSFGNLPMGVNTLTVDEPYDDVVGSVESGEAAIAIMAPGGSTVAWCGPA